MGSWQRNDVVVPNTPQIIRLLIGICLRQMRLLSLLAICEKLQSIHTTSFSSDKQRHEIYSKWKLSVHSLVGTTIDVSKANISTQIFCRPFAHISFLLADIRPVCYISVDAFKFIGKWLTIDEEFGALKRKNRSFLISRKRVRLQMMEMESADEIG